MSDFFSNKSSEIPDEIWKAPAPMQRQVDAAVLWAELTGKHQEEEHLSEAQDKEAAFPLAGMLPGAVTGAVTGAATGNDKDSLAKRMAIGAGAGALGGSAGFHGSRLALGKVFQNPTVIKKVEKLSPMKQNLVMGGAVLGAGLAAPAAGGAGAALLADKVRNKKTKKEASALSKIVSSVANSPTAAGAAIGAPTGAVLEYAETRPGKKGLSRREINLRGQLASLREQEKITGNKGGKIDRLKKRLEKAEEARKNPAKAALKGAFGGAAFGSLGGYLGGKGLL